MLDLHRWPLGAQLPGLSSDGIHRWPLGALQTASGRVRIHPRWLFGMLRQALVWLTIPRRSLGTSTLQLSSFHLQRGPPGATALFFPAESRSLHRISQMTAQLSFRVRLFLLVLILIDNQPVDPSLVSLGTTARLQ